MTYCAELGEMDDGADRLAGALAAVRVANKLPNTKQANL